MVKLNVGKSGPLKRWLLAGSVVVTAAAAFVNTGTVAQEATQAEPVSQGGPATFRRLTEDQYRRGITQTFGEDIKVGGRFEPPVREHGLLAIGSSQVVVTPSGLEQYASRAREISAQVLDEKHRKAAVPCNVTHTFNQACAAQFVGKYGRSLFRRPLSVSEAATALALARRVTASSGSFAKGLSAGLANLLVSPSFVFRLETTESDPYRAGRRRLDAWSLASRISFLLWDAPPDAELLDAAASGALRTTAGLNHQVERLMASPKLAQGTRAFFSDMLAYDLFSGLSKDPALFPVFNPRLRDDAKEQSLRTIVNHLLTKRGDYRDLFTTKDTFLSRSLGALYGVPVDARGFADGWMPYTYPADAPHAGLLTMPAFLMLDASHEGRSSPTIRGMTVRQNFLCEEVPAPPANVNFSIVQDTNDPIRKTARMRLSAHVNDESCAGCHKITDPIGLAMENYDAVGKHRTHENGEVIDASGTFDGKAYRDTLELTRLIHASPSAPSCVVQRTLEYGLGRQIASGEEEWFGYLDQRFARDGYRFPDLLRRIATSPAFQAVSNGQVAVK